MSVPDTAVWTLCTGGWCWDLGTYKRSLESSHLLQLQRETFPSESDLNNKKKKSLLLQLRVTFGEVQLYKLQLISSLSLLAFLCLTPSGS